MAETAARGLELAACRARRRPRGRRGRPGPPPTVGDESHRVRHAVRADVSAGEPRRAQAERVQLRRPGRGSSPAARPSEHAKAAQHVGDELDEERVTEVFQQILGLAAARDPAARRPTDGDPRSRARAGRARAAPRLRAIQCRADGDPRPRRRVEGAQPRPSLELICVRGARVHRRPPGRPRTTASDYKDQLEQLRLMGEGELREVKVAEHLHARPRPDGPGGGQAVALDGRGQGSHSASSLVAEDRHTHLVASSGGSLGCPTVAEPVALRDPPGAPGPRSAGLHVFGKRSGRDPVRLREARAPRPIVLPAAAGAVAVSSSPRSLRAHPSARPTSRTARAAVDPPVNWEPVEWGGREKHHPRARPTPQEPSVTAGPRRSRVEPKDRSYRTRRAPQAHAAGAEYSRRARPAAPSPAPTSQLPSPHAAPQPPVGSQPR